MAVSHATPPQASPRAGAGPGARAPEERKGGAALFLLAIPMVLCCGGPLIFAALAAASAATLGVVGGVIGAVLLAVGLGLFVRHCRRAAACCAPGEKAWRP